MQEAIQASTEGQPYVISSVIRVSRLIDCLIAGLCGAVTDPVFHLNIVTWTQDNLCSLVQLIPEAFDIPNLGQHKIRQLCSQLLKNVTNDDDFIREPANVLLNIFQTIYQADQLVPLILEILEDLQTKQRL